jgi:hypothetical protein
MVACLVVRARLVFWKLDMVVCVCVVFTGLVDVMVVEITL